MDERLFWEKQFDSICSKVGICSSAGIGAMRRVKSFVPLPTLKMLLYNPISIIVHRYEIIAEFASKIGCKNIKIRPGANHWVNLRHSIV